VFHVKVREIASHIRPPEIVCSLASNYFLKINLSLLEDLYFVPEEHVFIFALSQQATRLTISTAVIFIEITGCITLSLPLITSIMFAKWASNSTNVSQIYQGLMGLKNQPFLAVNPDVKYSLENFTAGQVIFYT